MALLAGNVIRRTLHRVSLAVFLLLGASPFSSPMAQERDPLHLVLLMDASGSMKKTDPAIHRKLAAQAVVTMLSPDDEVAVAEFEADARVLSKWRPASDREQLISAINKVSKDGGFTDFRAGLEVAGELFSGTPEGARKVILLLTDGILEPNPKSKKYSPFHLEYAKATFGKGRAARNTIYKEQFLEKLAPCARRIIDTEVLPVLQDRNVEVYAVGFSPGADTEFLQYLAEQTTVSKSEIHHFHAEESVDLMDVFLSLLNYWTDFAKLYVDEGNVRRDMEKSVFIDEFLTEVMTIAVTSEESTLRVENDEGEAEGRLSGTHPNLSLVPLDSKAPPGDWSYGFDSGSGTYRLLIVGRSAIQMRLENFQERSKCMEEVEGHVLLVLDGKDARRFLGAGSEVRADVMSDSGKQTLVLEESGRGYVFRYRPEQFGVYRLRFTLFARDKSGREMLPRPSRMYRFEVLPNFFVEPDLIDFGNVGKGKSAASEVTVTYCLENAATVRARSVTTTASRCKNEPEKQPSVRGDAFSIGSREVVEREIVLTVPGNSCWGDYEGQIVFSTDRGEPYPIGFRVHVPNFFLEKLLPLLIILVLILLALGIILLITWCAITGSPVGILRPTEYPGGMLEDFELGRYRRGFKKTCLYRRKHIIRIGSGRADIRLDELPPGLEVDLVFYRFLDNYVKNVSPRKSGLTILVTPSDTDLPMERGPGESYRLEDGLKIKVGDYEFKYERLWN